MGGSTKKVIILGMRMRRGKSAVLVAINMKCMGKSAKHQLYIAVN